MAAPQSFKSHTRYDPAFHFVLVPILLLNFILTVFVTVRHWPDNRFLHIWLAVVAIALLLTAGVARSSALRAQDRVIRLEERLRLAALLPATDRPRIDELSLRQLIALRFASDAEIPALVHKTLTQGLEPKAIKQNIVTWRPDYDRV
jgi:hypothetical protein